MAGPCCSGEVLFQASLKPRMREASVFEIRNHRAFAVNRGSKARSDGQGQNAIMFAVANTVCGFSDSHRIGVVEHGKSTTVELIECSPHILTHPSRAKIWCRGRS